MNNPSITAVLNESMAASPCTPASTGSVPLETLGRLLGYTEKELVLASEVLSQFTWNAPAKSGSHRTADTEPSDSDPSRKRAA